jgi:DNA-binding transcriptional MerR regulator/effector-binding domain-containing protein
MERRLYKIGEISKMYGLSVKTLRYYEEIGLLVPAYISKETKYRYYSWHQFETIRLIIYLRSLDLPIKEILQQINTKKGRQYIEILKRHCELMERRIQEEMALKRFIENRIEEIEKAELTPQDQVIFRRFPEQKVLLFKRVIQGIEEHERAVLDFLEKYHFHSGIARFGQVFSLERIREHRDDACDGIYVTDEAYTDDMLETKGDTLYSFPAGLYAVMYYKRPTEDSHPFWSTLLYEIDRLSYKPVGYVIRIIIFERGISIEGDDYLACMRVLVKEENTPDPSD